MTLQANCNHMTNVCTIIYTSKGMIPNLTNMTVHYETNKAFASNIDDNFIIVL